MTSKKIVKVYLLGDSICFGQLVNSYQTWPSLVARALNAKEKNETTYLLQNAGVNGNTTRQALERLHYDVTSQRPMFVLVQFGMNDCNYWRTDGDQPRVSPAAFKANLVEIISKCHSSGVRHCFLNTNHPSAKGPFEHVQRLTYDESNQEYNTYIRQVAEEMHWKGARLTSFDIENF